MMSKAEREEYFIWLCNRVATPENRDYTTLFELMHTKEFVWTVGNDDNRIQDGRDLKRLYLNTKFKKKVTAGEKQRSYDEPVTVLEVLIGLSERLSFLIDVEAPICAYTLIENLELDKYRNNIHKIDDILEKLIWRTYRYNGSGGFFPLKHPSRDQKSVEIWYQMAEWIEENYNPHDI